MPRASVAPSGGLCRRFFAAVRFRTAGWRAPPGNSRGGAYRRREETAATRSLLNTARLMEENPTLLRLKELETLEKVTEKIDKLTVFGGLEGVLKDVVRIQVPST